MVSYFSISPLCSLFRPFLSVFFFFFSLCLSLFLFLFYSYITVFERDAEVLEKNLHFHFWLTEPAWDENREEEGDKREDSSSNNNNNNNDNKKKMPKTILVKQKELEIGIQGESGEYGERDTFLKTVREERKVLLCFLLLLLLLLFLSLVFVKSSFIWFVSLFLLSLSLCFPPFLSLPLPLPLLSL